MSDQAGAEATPLGATNEQPADQAQTAATPTEATGADDGKQSPEEKRFTQDELDRIVTKRIAQEASRADRRVVKAVELALQRVVPILQPTSQPQQPTGPQLADYGGDVEAYTKAVVAADRQQREQEARQARQQQENLQISQTAQTLYSRAEKVDGFDREVFDELPISDAATQALLVSDKAPELMAFFCANPSEALRIHSLPHARQLLELGKLEDKIQVAKPSKAPAPIKALGAKSTADSSLPSDQDSIDEWMRKERERMRKRNS